MMKTICKKQVEKLLSETGLAPQNMGQIVDYYYATTVDGVYEIRCEPGQKCRVRFGRWKKGATERSMRNEWWNGDVPYGHCRMHDVKVIGD